MVIIEDTRNQIGKHEALNKQLTEMGHTIVRSKLFVGDYAEAKNQSVCIDTKQDILELAGNICGKQHTRFREECIRAMCAEIRLIILIEEETSIPQWESPKNRQNRALTQVKGETLFKAMITMHRKYGVTFAQCNKKDTARKIIELLGEEQNERTDQKN